VAQLANARVVLEKQRVLDTQRQVLSAEQQEARSSATVSTNLVSLYKALGGGWDTPVQAAAD
jgi:outer membrane protein TolC